MPIWTSWIVINPGIKFYYRPPIDPSKNGSGYSDRQNSRLEESEPVWKRNSNYIF
jgi:hypothetical protein